MEYKECQNCGAELLEGQEFCPKCGQKICMVNEEQISSEIGQVDGGDGEKKKKIKKIILSIAIPLVLIAIGVLLFSLLSESFKGKYVYVSDNSSRYYDFGDDGYIYITSDDTEQGKYAVEKDQVTLTGSDGDETILYRDGKYLFMSQFHYDEKIHDGNTVNQSFADSINTDYKGCTIALNRKLMLSSDGMYTYTMEMTLYGITFGDKYNESGTYEKSGNKLILSPKGENYKKTLIIKDGIIYYTVFMKEK